MTVKEVTVNHSFSYNEYFELVKEQAEKKLTSGEQAEEHVEATKMNFYRMQRLNRQVEINEKLAERVRKLSTEWNWVILAETWCGDGAQTIPVIAKISEHNPKINLKIIFRDENPSLMDKYLTKGTRSIPKLICCETKSQKEIGTWGPRPEGIKQKAEEFKAEHPDISPDDFKRHLHFWYAQDKGESVQHDFYVLLSAWL